MPRSRYQLHALGEPVVEPLLGLVGRDEVLHLHLLELAGAEDEVLRRDLVAEGLADLGDAEGRLLARRAEHVGEVGEHALGRLGAQVGDVALVLHRAGVGLEHQVEGAGLGQVVGAAVGADALDLVGPPALVAVLAVDQGVGEGGQVARGGPDGRRAEDGGVEADHVVAQLDHGAPPGVLDVAQHVDPERAVVVGGAEAAVDLGRREDEAAGAAQPHHLLHQVVAGSLGRPRRSLSSVQDTGADSGADLVGQQPAPQRQHGAAVDVARRGPPSSSGRSRLSQGTPRGVRSDERERLELPLLGASAPRGRPRASARPRWRRCSGRACARSTSACRRGASGRPSRCRRSRPAPSRGGCAGTRGRAGPSWRSPPSGSRRR